MKRDLYEAYTCKLLKESTTSEWRLVRTKSVPDSDGFMTDYTWYTNGETNIFMFGDRDYYEPDQAYADWECDSEEEAEEWFDNYEGFAEDEDELYECGSNPSKEEFFDKGFEEAYGIEPENDGNDLDQLNESFGNFPQWFKDELIRNKSLKNALLKKNIDLHNATFIPHELPKNAFDPAFKDLTKLPIFRIQDTHGKEYVYIKGIYAPEIFFDKSDFWAMRSVDNIARKRLLDLTMEYGYIDLTYPATSMKDVRNDRYAMRMAAERDGTARGKGQYAVKRDIYATDEDGRKNYNDVIGQETVWVLSRGCDKSGYKLDPDKYARMLDNVGLEDYSVRLEMWYKQLEDIRSRLISRMNSLDITDSRNFRTSSFSRTLFSDIGEATRRFGDAIDAYSRLQERIERIVSKNIPDEEKDERIRTTFNWEGSSVRDAIKRCRNELKEIENPTPIPRDSEE